MIDFSEIDGFNWDLGNLEKNWIKHSVSRNECEESFLNEPFVVHFDEIHSITENRFYALCKTNANRRLFIVFTIRKNKIRVISARDMSKKEKLAYENFKKDP